MVEFQNLIKSVHPGIFIHSVYIDPDLKEDQRASFVRLVHSPLPASAHAPHSRRIGRG